MLFPLTINALSHNWIGLLLMTTLSQGMVAINTNQALPAWPPQGISEERKNWLSRHSGFKKKIRIFFDEYQKLTVQQRALVQQAQIDQTNLPAIFSSHQPCSIVSGMVDMKSAIDELFSYSFGQLSCNDDLGTSIRDRHYSDIYDQLPDRICPFCGLSPMRGKNSPRHHLDHWMAISIYPFAGADLRNLCPMCDTCNSTFKGNKDILHNAVRQRRRSVNPYHGPIYKISLSNSEWGRGIRKYNYAIPEWHIDFVGVSLEEAETWDDVLKIRSRYRNDVLDPEFFPWIRHFAQWFKGELGFENTRSGIIQSFQPYIQRVIQERFADNAFLKAEVFRFLESASQSPEHGEDVTGMLLSIADNI
ncbi:TPA: hypothetical protein QIF53_003889 [Serratia marcescens]|uniref:hypothetical protein n=1 Tax=Enterobacter pseudoroggenkampii TaxID=2996112 RepID=UPI0025B26D76|nr:hypothetical protein [Enterobacter pseudoroggenkampii]WJW85076.1 hypothetical protein QVH39_17800 [Enterobacter pseudoroggenkampii]HEO9035528.1 hypothetical protein [Serratia marcescens]